MKKTLLLLLLSLQTLMAQEKKDETLPLNTIIAIINNSLDSASERLEAYPLNISTAEISLKTSYSKSVTGGFTFLVKASHGLTLDKATTMKFTYKKPTDNEKAIQKINNERFIQANLTDAIVDAAIQWQKADEVLGGLPKNKFSVELSLIVKKTTGAGFEFELWGVGAETGGDYSNNAVHTISLTFE